MVYSDLLMILPVQWTQSPLLGMVQQIPVRELIPAPAICLVRRNGLPLTPAAEYFCDMLSREAHPLRLPVATPAAARRARRVSAAK